MMCSYITVAPAVLAKLLDSDDNVQDITNTSLLCRFLLVPAPRESPVYVQVSAVQSLKRQEPSCGTRGSHRRLFSPNQKQLFTFTWTGGEEGYAHEMLTLLITQSHNQQDEETIFHDMLAKYFYEYIHSYTVTRKRGRRC
eukprot:g68628.t1